jgi:protoporphyrinogen/coproporphyrinogen III oxidase
VNDDVEGFARVEPPRRTPPSIAVVGGGIAGLAAAHRLVELAPDVRVVLFESAGRLGGVLSTVHQDGFQVEQSADNFITTNPWAVDLCKRLGLAGELMQTNPAFRRTFVVRRGRLCKLPDGFLMMAPTRLWPMAVTPILSPWGKLRAAMEYFIPPRLDEADESMAAFVRRRLGREVFDRLVEPLVSAVYAADMERLSVEATLARFREMERRHGSLIRAMRYQMKRRPRAGGESGARYSMFVTLREGLSSLVEAIAARLPQGAVRLGAEVTATERAGDGRWRLTTALTPNPSPKGRGEGDDFDAVIVAAPSHAAARLLRPLDAELGDELAAIEHSGTAIVSLGYRREQVGHPLDGMGAVVPAAEQSPILACSFSSQKYAHRAPEGKLLLRVFVGGARRPELAEMDDRPLTDLVLGALRPLLRIEGEPCYCDVAHWPGTMPQFHVGHKERVARIRRRLEALGGVELAGNAYQGVGIPDCIDTGEKAAQRVLEAG